jgi:uncharacterized protein (DUF305 family)
MMKKPVFFYVLLIIIFITTAAYSQKHDIDNRSGNKIMMDDKKSMKGGMMMDMMVTDKHFIEKMIPHHKDAIDMAKLALEKSEKSEIKKLSQDIITSQTAKIENMKMWYKEWFGMDVPVKPTQMDSKGKRMDMMGQGMMMIDMGMSHEMMGGTIDDLTKAPDFDKKFLGMMVLHHKMAVMMSGMILDSKKSEMRTLAKDIIAAQSQEIEMMIKWYQSWYGSW